MRGTPPGGRCAGLRERRDLLSFDAIALRSARLCVDVRAGFVGALTGPRRSAARRTATNELALSDLRSRCCDCEWVAARGAPARQLNDGNASARAVFGLELSDALIPLIAEFE